MQLASGKKMRKLSSLIFMAFLALLGAGLTLSALPAYAVVLHSVPDSQASHYVQHPTNSSASALFASAVVLLTQKTLPANSSRLSESMSLRASLKSALSPAGIPQLCSLHAASATAPRLVTDILSQVDCIFIPLSPLHFRFKNAILQKFVSFERSIFAPL